MKTREEVDFIFTKILERKLGPDFNGIKTVERIEMNGLDDLDIIEILVDLEDELNIDLDSGVFEIEYELLKFSYNKILEELVKFVNKE